MKEAKGKLGILTIGVGAVATTFMAGTLLTRKGQGVPVGSITQLATMRLGKREENRFPKIKDAVPLADLNDVVFGGWDIFEENAYEAAVHADVLTKDDLNKVKDEAILGSIDPLRQVMGRLEAQGEALNRLTFLAWAKSLLISLAICLGVWGSVQAGMSWLAHEIRSQQQVLDSLNGEISQAEQTLAQLPKGISFVSDKGRHYIVAKQIGEPFEVTNGNAKGKMAVGVK